jgi:hypothetical protein
MSGATITKFLFTFILVLSIGACDKAKTTASTTASTMGSTCASSQITTAKNTKVLFIGNSYTSVNCLPDLFKNLSNSAGVDVEIAASFPGGESLAKHSALQGTLHLINSATWDFVVLQDQSQIPALRIDDIQSHYLPGVESLANSIHKKSPNAQIIYFVTWGYKNGDPLNCVSNPLVCDFRGMNEALLVGYRIYKNATGGSIANVGGAWKAVADDKHAPIKPDELWQGDGSHPTLLGSYLAAATIFSKVFNRSPIGLSYPLAISSEIAVYLQKTAASVKDLPNDPTLGSFMDVAKNADGSLKTMNQADAIEYCSAQGAHLPSASEFVQFAMRLGAKGIADSNLDDSFHKFNVTNVNGTENTFYFSSDGYRPPADAPPGNILFWSSSVLSNNSVRGFVWGADYGFISDVVRNYTVPAVGCVLGR